MNLTPLTLETATALLSLANAHVWHMDHASGHLLADAATLALWLDALPGPTQLPLAELRPLVHPSDWAALVGLCGPVVANGPQTATVRLRNRNGAWRWLKLCAQVVARAPEGRPTHSVGLVSDASARVRQNMHRQLQQTFDSAMAASPDRDTLARAMVDAAMALPDLDRCGLYLRDADGGYTLATSEGLSPVFLTRVGQLVPGHRPAQLADAGQLVCSFADGPLANPPDPHGTPHPLEHGADWAFEPALLQRPAVLAEGIQALVVLPIRVGGAVRACLNLASTQARRLPECTVTALQTLATQFGLALERLATREKAQHQRDNLEGFFHALQDYVVVLDEQGRIQCISHSVRQQLGHGDELLGQPVLALHPPRVHAQVMEVVRAMLAGERDSCPLPVLTADGREVMADTRTVRGHWNGQPALLAVLRDITALTELQRELALRTHYQQATLDNIPFLVWLKDTQGRFLAVNRPFAQACGRSSPEDLVGLTDPDVWPADLARAYQADDRAVLASGQSGQSRQSRQTEELIESTGQRQWSETYKSPVIVNGELMGTVGCAHDTTARKQAEAERDALLAQLQSIAEQVPGIVCQYRLRTDGTAHFPYASGAMMGMLGVSPESVRDDDSTAMSAIHPDDLPRVTETLLASARTLTLWRQEFRVRAPQHPNGMVWLHAQGSPQRQPDGSTLWHTYLQDITEERHARERLRLGANVFANSYNGIMVTDAHHVIVEVNPAFSRITGYGPDEVLGCRASVLKSGRHGADFYAAMRASIHGQGHWSGEIWNRHKNGEVYPEAMSISAVTDEAGQPTHYIGVFSDITVLKSHEAQLAHIAHCDVLTGLPNRRLLGDRMQVALAQARRDKLTLSVCMLDLDGFKAVNDEHGHAAGDALLVEVARRLQSSLRENDTVARLGGDEFVLLMADLQHPQESHSTLERVLQAIAQPIALGGAMVSVSASLGMTRYPHDDADADTLLRHADQAMYAAKQAGKNRYHLFDPEHEHQIQTHRAELAHLQRALTSGELVMHYQPQVNLHTGAVIGMEALIRWQHPTEGLLLPARFLSLMMGNAFECRLGEWVIDQVLAQMAHWKALGLDLVVRANISTSHLLHDRFAEHLALALAAHPQANPQQLELEILETAAIGDMALVSQVLHRCRALGVRFALDDFGTGYASLSHFRSLPVDMIKIDQRLVHDMLEDPNDLGIVDSVVRLAQAFNRPVIAEGVETLMHGSALLQLGCTLAQGYGVARPMPAEQVPGWMAQWQTQAVWKTLHQLHPGRDLALSVATRSHRNWVASALQLVKDTHQQPGATPDNRPCHLGRWLMGSGATAYSDSPHYQSVCRLHQQAHDLVNRMLDDTGVLTPSEDEHFALNLQTTSTQLLAHLAHMTQPQA